jgi:hypothetical protein
MNESIGTTAPLPATRGLDHEARWPVTLSILVVVFLLQSLPPRIQLFPRWTPYLLAVLVLSPILLVSLSAGELRWLRLERRVTLTFAALIALATAANLANIIEAMLDHRQGVAGLQLLASSIGVWVANVLAFSLLYWQLDRGGPLARSSGSSPRPDWSFPQDSAGPEQVASGWRPTFPDYLFLGYCSATAFSPTDVLPLTARAKMLVMVESAVSLATIVVVASRAINILGS